MFINCMQLEICKFKFMIKFFYILTTFKTNIFFQKLHAKIKKKTLFLFQIYDLSLLPFMHSRDFKVSKKFFTVIQYFILLIFKLVLLIENCQITFIQIYKTLLNQFSFNFWIILCIKTIDKWEELPNFYYYYIHRIIFLRQDYAISTLVSHVYYYIDLLNLTWKLLKLKNKTNYFINDEDDLEEFYDYDD